MNFFAAAKQLTIRSTGRAWDSSLARRTVEDHGGEIRVEDHAGGGAEFVVSLPAAKEDHAPHPADEDEPGLVLTITDLLKSEGCDVVAETDGESGLGTVRGGGFDLLVLDLDAAAKVRARNLPRFARLGN